MSGPAYEAWCVPTEINKSGKPYQIGGSHPNEQAARDALYFDRMDEPSPDKDQYYRWIVVCKDSGLDGGGK